MTRHIVVAEDEEHLGYMVKFRLSKAGYSVTWKRDGLSAWKAIQAELPQVVILEVAMPGLNGFQVLEHIKATPETREAAVIMLTTEGQASDIAQGLKTGAADCIVKPVKPAELLARVQRVCPFEPGTPPAA
jgi:DNA-binding response OmpR family regulator